VHGSTPTACGRAGTVATEDAFAAPEGRKRTAVRTGRVRAAGEGGPYVANVPRRTASARRLEGWLADRYSRAAVWQS
jgi:hypothetical protein